MRKPQRSRGATGHKSRHRAETVATTMILSIGASLSGALRTEHYETNAIPSIVRAKWPLFEKGTVPTQRFKLLPSEVSRQTLKSQWR